MSRTRGHTCPVLKAGIWVSTSVTLLCTRPVTQLTVWVAAPTNLALCVVIETIRALRYAVALMEEVGFVALFRDTMEDSEVCPQQIRFNQWLTPIVTHYHKR